MFSPDQWAASTGVSFFNNVATQSLRFDSASSASLSGSMSSSPYTWTFSAWVKRSKLSTLQVIGGARTTGVFASYISFQSANTLEVVLGSGGTQTTTRLFRDTSAWYHVVVSCTGASGTAKLYINGVEEMSWSAGTTPYLFTNTLTYNASIGQYGGNVYYFDGYMAEVNFLDGTAIGDSDTDGYLDEFGELKNGVWIPKQYTGSYGTNGFRLQFNQTGTGTASSSTIGADTSGVIPANHFSSSGIDTEDCDMPDSPENRFATICPLSSGPATFSEGNLKFNGSNLTGNTNFGIFNGKFYAEVYVNAGSNWYIGVLDISRGVNPNRGGSWSSTGAIAYKANGDVYSLPVGGSSATASYGASYTTGDIIGIAVDVDSDTITFYKNGVSQGSTTNGVSHISSDGVYGVLIYGTSSILTVNFGQDSTFAGATTAGGNADANGKGDFKYSVPSGYLALCTANLPEPTISPNADTQADDYFNTVLYNGNGSTQDISGVGFKPDFLWIKRQNLAASHNLRDSTRGPLNHLQPDGSGSEDTESGVGVTAFLDDGFRLNGTNAGTGQVNVSGGTFVAWNLKANGGTTSAGGGSITSTVQANTDAGFSIVTYTGTGTGGTIGHGLGSSPEVTIIKKRNGIENWYYQSEVQLGSWTYNLRLDTTQGRLTSTTLVTGVSADTVTVSTSTAVNGSGTTYVMYCFRSIEGYSKFGSYTGNASTNGTFVYTGFRPAWVMVKSYSTSGDDWFIFDNKRQTYNVIGNYLRASADTLEQSSTLLDFVSNGFKFRASSGAVNDGTTFIYMAFAEQPFRYANAR